MSAGADPFSSTMRIDAPPEIVFDCFCDPRALMTWLGEYAELEPRPGGAFVLDVGPFQVRGQYQVVERPRRLVFSWGFADSETFPPGTSTVEVTLEAVGAATDLTLLHTGLPMDEAPRHAQGWAKYMPQLASAASRLAGERSG